MFKPWLSSRLVSKTYFPCNFLVWTTLSSLHSQVMEAEVVHPILIGNVIKMKMMTIGGGVA